MVRRVVAVMHGSTVFNLSPGGHEFMDEFVYIALWSQYNLTLIGPVVGVMIT